MSGTIFHDGVPFGGATSVDTLVDVNLGENGPSDGDILVYDESTGMWKPSGNLSTLNSNNLGTAVNVTSYNTEQNMYVCPSDGYLYISNGTGSPGLARAIIYSANNNNAIAMSGFSTSQYIYQDSIFVRKGMRIMCLAGNAVFYPL